MLGIDVECSESNTPTNHTYSSLLKTQTKKQKNKTIRCGGILLACGPESLSCARCHSRKLCYNHSPKYVVTVLNREILNSGIKKWGLPKGHIKSHESISDCASREIYEETGLMIKFDDESPKIKLNDTFYYIKLIPYNSCFHIKDTREIAGIKMMPISELPQINANRGLKKFSMSYQRILEILLWHENNIPKECNSQELTC